MNWLIVAVTAAFVLLEGILATWEGTLTKSGWCQVKFPFINHAGIWGDLLLFSLVNGLVWDHLRWRNCGIIVPVCLVATLTMHYTWFSTQDLTSWLWPLGTRSNCWFSLSETGWLHVIFMTAQLSILVLYVINPVPATVAWSVAGLLTIFWPLGIILPCWYITGRWIDTQAIIASLVLLGGTWGFTIFKVY